MFKNGEIDDIPKLHLGEQSLHVLPKMTKGKLVSVSRKITPCEWIKNHEDMRMYWKNTYGYELPSNFGQIFCNISFVRSIDNPGYEVFCYPIEVLLISVLPQKRFDK